MSTRVEIEKKFHRYLNNFGTFCEEKLYIKDEYANIRTLDIRDRYAQRTIAEYLCGCLARGEPIRLIILKARRFGISTIVNAFYFYLTALGYNRNCYVFSHDETGVGYLFDMHKLFYDMLDPDIKPMKRIDNSKKLCFENPVESERADNPGRRSEIRVGSLKGRNTGSGYLTHLLHLSELAKAPAPEELMASIKPSVPKPPKFSSIIIESTAFGAGNYFHKRWLDAKAGIGGYKPMFFAWFQHEEYVLPVPEGFTLSAHEKAIKNKYNLTDGRMVWRRWVLEDDCDGDEDIFKQEYPANENEAFLVTGRTVFAPSTLEFYENHPPVPVWEGELEITTGPRGEESVMTRKEDGKFKIFEFPDIGRQNEYCLGADVAEGIDLKVKGKKQIGDRSSFHIINRETGGLAASWVGHIAADTFGKMLVAVGKYYNEAFLGIEANNHGLTTLTIVKMYDYDLERVYHRESYENEFDTYTKKMGWWTSVKTKPLLVDNLAAALRHHYIGYVTQIDGKDKFVGGLPASTISELGTFTKDAQGRTGGTEGCYDDQVISLGIAWMMVLKVREAVVEVKELPKGLRDFNEGPTKLAALTMGD